MLFCTNCKRVMDEGISQCPYCRAGFTIALACVICKKNVVAGATSCQCFSNRAPMLRRQYEANQGESEERALSYVPPPPTGGGVLSASIPMPSLVPEVYSHGRHGVVAEVQMNGRDAEILNKMGAAATLLHALALEMNGLVGHMQSTRSLIRNCRNLASDLQEEIEVRVGPRG